MFHSGFDFTRQDIDFFNRFDFVSKELNTNGRRIISRKEDFHYIPTNTKRSTAEIIVVTLELHFYQSA